MRSLSTFADVQGPLRTGGESNESSDANQRVHTSNRLEYRPDAVRLAAGIEDAENARDQRDRGALAARRRHRHAERPLGPHELDLDEGRPSILLFRRFSLEFLGSFALQISDSAMVLEEQPGKLAEAFRLFLQGEGYGKF